ncbi:peptidyl-prolyl cis-trans isomerase [Nitratifractor sp.]|uniref:peptidylprolyl isomerase n=1 Tax=Nitratifractor sp. TaxID=2268144 RepID=UPI0025FE0C90|nr:peptidyl-prolyl cis-trans isomerase [Nitratifractor sp.]
MKMMKRTLAVTALCLGMGSTLLCASDVVATVNGHQITKEDLNAFLQQSMPNQPITYDMLDPKTKKKVLDGLIETEILSEAAQKAGVEKDPEFQRMLKLAKQKLMINAWAKQQFDKIIVSESEAKEFYQKHADKFAVPARVHARHILVKDEKKAQEIIDQLKGLKGEALKQKFIELAKKESTGPTGSKGGDLGYFTPKQMVLPFSKAAFALQPGEITLKPVKTQFGWHVIYVEDKKPAQTIPFDKVKDRVIATLKQQRFVEKMKQETDLLKKNADIKIEGAESGKEKSTK